MDVRTTTELKVFVWKVKRTSPVKLKNHFPYSYQRYVWSWILFSDWVNLIFEFRLFVPIKLLAKSMVTFSMINFKWRLTLRQTSCGSWWFYYIEFLQRKCNFLCDGGGFKWRKTILTENLARPQWQHPLNFV